MIHRPFENCVLASDIDGTLVDSGYCPADNIKYINRFTDDGGIFVLATGRSVGGLEPIKKILGFLSVCIVYNGGMIYDYKNEKLIYERYIAQEDKCFLLDIINNFSNIGAEVHSFDNVYVFNGNNQTKDHIEYENLKCFEKTFEEIKSLKWHKIVITLNNKESEGEKIIELADKFGFKDSYIMYSSCIIDGIKRDLLEISPVGVSKASAIKVLKEKMNIKNGNLFAIGDYYNDIPMLDLADISAATNNSPDTVKSAADYVAADCKEAAVADFIKYLYKAKKEGCK